MSAPVTQQSHAVYFREHWSDAWTAQPHVYCESFSEVSGPDVSESTLTYNYGHVLPADSQNITGRTPLSVNGWYAKIVLNQFTADDDATVRTWYGVIVATDGDRRGWVTSRGEAAETGTQTFHCRGLEFLLQRSTIDSSFVLNSAGSEIEIGRAIAFNLGPGRETDHARLGNRSEVKGENDAYIFAFTISVGGVVEDESGKIWSALDIITYLFNYHPPEDTNSVDQLNWTVSDGADGEILNKLFPAMQAQGKTVKQILDEIIDRRRLIGWTIIFQGDPPHPKLDLFTFNKDTVTLPSGLIIPGNSDQQTWHFDNDLTIKSAVVSEDDATRFDVVIARGECIGACFTVASSAGSTSFYGLVKDWDASLVTAYNAGASASGSYAALMSIDKQAANQAFRADDVFAKVFRAFLLDPAFDGKLGGTTICPDPSLEDAEGTPGGTSTPFWYPGLRFLDRLPLRTDYDYSTVDGFETTSLTIDSSQPNYLRPFAVVFFNALYYRLDNPGQGKLTAEMLADEGLQWAGSLRMQDNCPGLLIDVQGAPQHAIASADFTPVDADDTADVGVQVNWKNIACTVFCEFDQHVEARYPEGELSTDTDVVRELIIDVPNARLDYLTPNTCVGIDDTGSIIHTDGGYVRDDRVLLQDIARVSYEWYKQTRKAITVVQHDLVCDFSVGTFITTIGTDTDPVEVNSVVTKIVFDVRNGNITIFTQYAELDALRSGLS